MPSKRCYYETMELERTATEDEIKSAYRRLARIWHPDKNLHQIEIAEEAFKEIRGAYEVLSDPNERAWYDAHREEILAGGDGTGSARDDGADLWQYFSPGAFSGYGDKEGGFFRVFTEAFEAVDLQERSDAKSPEAPVFGHSTSSYTETVRPFYNFWINFSSQRTFAWKDVYNTTQAPNRDVRRIMEKENKKERDKAKREFNELVRRLAEFARKKDPRVLNWAKEQAALKVLREAEEKEMKERKAAEVKAKQQAARAAQEEQLDSIDLSGMDLQDLMSAKDLKRHKHLLQDDEEDGEDDVVEEFYCPACKKVFKSDKQFKNHENSKKHKDMAAKLRKELMAEDEAADAAIAAKKNANKTETEEDIFVDDDDEFIEDLETIRHADDDLVHIAAEIIDEDDSDGDEVILADLSQYRLHEAPVSQKADTEVKKSGESAKKDLVQEEDADDGEDDDDMNDDMLAMMSSSKPRFNFGDDSNDEEEDVEPVTVPSAKGGKKSFNFADFEASLPSSGASSPAPKAAETEKVIPEADAGKKKRRRAVKEKAAPAPVAVAEPEPEYERGAKRGGKGKKGARGAAAAAAAHHDENSCRTCGSSFPSKTALHAHLKETKHAIAN